MLEGDRLLTAMAYNIMKMHRSKCLFCLSKHATIVLYLVDKINRACVTNSVSLGRC